MKSLAGPAFGLLLSLTATAATAQDADLSVILLVSPQSAKPGDRVTFSAKVSNLSAGTATPVDATIRLPAGLTARSYSTNGGSLGSLPGDTGVRFSNATIPGGLSVDLIVTADLPLNTVPGAVLAGEAEVSSMTPDFNLANNRATATMTVAAAAPAVIPTLTEWAMILFAALLAGGAALTLHRRSRAA